MTAKNRERKTRKRLSPVDNNNDCRIIMHLSGESLSTAIHPLTQLEGKCKIINPYEECLEWFRCNTQPGATAWKYKPSFFFRNGIVCGGWVLCVARVMCTNRGFNRLFISAHSYRPIDVAGLAEKFIRLLSAVCCWTGTQCKTLCRPFNPITLKKAHVTL